MHFPARRTGPDCQRPDDEFRRSDSVARTYQRVDLRRTPGATLRRQLQCGRVEVLSATSNQRIGSFLPNPSASALTAMAMSPNGQYLLVTELFVVVNGPDTYGLTVINLNNSADRRHYPLNDRGQPLAVAFAINNEALVVTTTTLELFDPVDGKLTLLFDYACASDDPPPTCIGDPSSPVIDLPVPMPTFPREVLFANATSSRDYGHIYATTDAFVMSYDVAGRLGLLTIRPNTSLVAPPLFQQVSAADDGSYFLAGQILFDNNLLYEPIHQRPRRKH